jgi:hypothetical protein
MNKAFLIVVSMAILSGCAAKQTYTLANHGISRNLYGPEEDEGKALKDFNIYQEAVLTQLKAIAGLGSTPPATSNNWKSIIWAGILVVDQECHEYMSALYRIDQRKKEGAQHLNLFNATTAAIQGILDETARTISLTSSGLGFLEAAFSNLYSSILFDLDPAVVNEIVRKLQGKSKDRLLNDTQTTFTRALAMDAIYQYAEQCTPLRIETEVNNAINATDAQDGEGTLGATLSN